MEYVPLDHKSLSSEDKVNLLSHYKLNGIVHIHVQTVGEAFELVNGRWLEALPF